MTNMLLLLQPAFLQIVSWLLYGDKTQPSCQLHLDQIKPSHNFMFPDNVTTPALSACQSALQPGEVWPPQGSFSWVKYVVRH